MIDVRALLVAVHAALEADPELAARLRAAFGAKASDDDRLTLAESAKVARCGTRTLRDAVRAGGLPADRGGPGGRILIRRADLATWVAGRTFKPRPRRERDDAGRFEQTPAERAIARAQAAGKLRRVV